MSPNERAVLTALVARFRDLAEGWEDSARDYLDTNQQERAGRANARARCWRQATGDLESAIRGMEAGE